MAAFAFTLILDRYLGIFMVLYRKDFAFGDKTILSNCGLMSSFAADKGNERRKNLHHNASI